MNRQNSNQKLIPIHSFVGDLKSDRLTASSGFDEISTRKMMEVLSRANKGTVVLPTSRQILLAIILLCNIAVAGYLAWNSVPSLAESEVIQTIQGESLSWFNPNREVAAQSQLYMTLVWLWSYLVGDSIFLMRALNITMSVASCIIVHQLVLAMRFKCRLWVTALFALHPYTLFAASTLVDSALVLTLTVLLFLMFEKGFIRGHRLYQFIYILTLPFAVGVNLFLAIVALTQFLFLPLINRKYEFDRFRKYAAFAPLALLPLLYFNLPILRFEETSFVEVMKFFTGSISNFMIPLPRTDTTLAVRYILLVAIWLVCVYVFKYRLRRDKDWRGTATVSLTYLLFLASVFACVVGLGKVKLTNELAYPLMLPALGFWALLLERLSHIQRTALLVTTLLCCGFTVFSEQPVAPKTVVHPTTVISFNSNPIWWNESSPDDNESLIYSRTSTIGVP